MSGASTPIQSKDFWFEDGDIVLSVTEDDVEHHFRVHRLVLAISSPVFRDMLSMPQVSGGEGLPVPLLDDSVQDLTSLLGALYIGRKLQIVTFDVALGILRLSHKYQIEGLEQGMKLKLLEDWPLKRSEYLARLRFLGSLGSPDCRLPQALRVIETAQRCEANELLPTAFYELSCVEGTRYPEIMGKISSEHVARLWVGRARVEQRLRSFAVGSSHMLMWTVSPSKNSPSKNIIKTIIEHREDFLHCRNFKDLRSIRKRDVCSSIFPTFRTKLAERLFDGVSGLTILENFDRDDLDGSVCACCKDWFMSILRDKVAELWDNISIDFDLPKVRVC